MSTIGWASGIGLSLGLGTLGVWWQLRPAQAGAIHATSIVTASHAGPRACTVEAGDLDQKRVSEAVRDFLPSVLPCVSASAAPPGDLLHLRLQVACTGDVRGVELIEGGNWPGHVVGCVRNRLSTVLFPKHAALEGVVVDLPLRFPPLDASSGGR